jgi:hypothetical protein
LQDFGQSYAAEVRPSALQPADQREPGTGPGLHAGWWFWKAGIDQPLHMIVGNSALSAKYVLIVRQVLSDQHAAENVSHSLINWFYSSQDKANEDDPLDAAVRTSGGNFGSDEPASGVGRSAARAGGASGKPVVASLGGANHGDVSSIASKRPGAGASSMMTKVVHAVDACLFASGA